MALGGGVFLSNS
jgi:hypothetical protein